MKRGMPKSFDAISYFLLALSLAISALCFYRSEQYRADTDVLLTETYEIQRRASLIREIVANTIGEVRLAIATENYPSTIQDDVDLLSFNISATKDLEYSSRYLEPKELNRLTVSISIIDTEINPILNNHNQYDSVLSSLYMVKDQMIHFSGSAMTHTLTAKDTTRIHDNALRNTTIFATSLFLFMLFGVMIHQRAAFAQRKDQQIRSFASLFAHMTRSRVTGLALFLGRLRGSTTEDPEMVAAAFRTAKELDAINDGLLKIAYTAKPAGGVSLATVLETIGRDHGGQDHGGQVRFDVRDDARDAVVASPQLHLILDELIRNAENAVAAADRAAPLVIVRGRLAPRFPIGHRLILEVTDNGIGMTQAVRDKATEPFFSLRAGSHVGLGLTSCAEMAKALGGKLTIQSAENVGTTVRISYPVTRLAMGGLRNAQAEGDLGRSGGRIAGE